MASNHHPPREGQVQMLCWCGASIKRVPVAMVRDGETWCCSDGCSEVTALTRQVGEGKGGRQKGQKDRTPRRKRVRYVIVRNNQRCTYINDGNGNYTLDTIEELTPA